MMPKADDCTLPKESEISVKKEALKILKKADAIGRFPTPTSEIVEAGKIKIAPPNIWSINFIKQLRAKADTLLKALSKVFGIFDSYENIIYVDPGIHDAKKPFLTLHEVGHARMPWQRKVYSLFEDCEKTLKPEIAEQFEREANVFASEVLFQGDLFTEDAASHDFSMQTPILLSKKYGASIYSSIRRYVRTSYKACAVIVLNAPEKGKDYAVLRRIETSPQFAKQFYNFSCSDRLDFCSKLGKAIPLYNQKASGPIPLDLQDVNGLRYECIVEGFSNTYQTFLLIYPEKELTRKIFTSTGTEIEI